ncbi:putative lipoprotein GfcB [Vibrio stylophorae]|nr:YjbF family lipoprotein [Vibrio stylophorae]CAH0536298.1 putative lipoprotein GfcB [Vibrio stylophorae]
MIVTEAGRIIKTVGLSEINLTASYAETADPLALGLHLKSTPTTWQRQVDWQPGHHVGYLMRSQFKFQAAQSKVINERQIHTLYYTELVTLPELELTFTNHFWIDPNSGRVIASIQQPAPYMSPIELTILKPYANSEEAPQ